MTRTLDSCSESRQELLSYGQQLLSSFISAAWRLTVENRLRVLRAEAGISQGELAQRLGVSRQTINAVETDKYDPSLPLALRLAKVFGVPVDAIFLDDWAPDDPA
ncbi:MAG: helix-turn-helix transcriptional regulator [Sphingomonas sp.]|nr:helix-turn-helix transcriptional regulator [Sphingomonas sp.]